MSTMLPIWLIEAGVYRDEVNPLLDEIRQQGMAVELVQYESLRKGSCPLVNGQPLQTDACVIGYGTYPFAQQILLHQSWTPGAWCSANNLDCATYYPHFGKYLLNKSHTILTGVDAIRRRDELFAEFATDDGVFARPTSSHKLFVGRCIHRESFATALAPTRYDPTTQVVIATPRPKGREWRLVVIDGRVVSGSQYMAEGVRNVTPDCPAAVRSFAEGMLADVSWQPDLAFMLDVCESDGRFWLVELNSFSGSWLYRCDLRVVVQTASDLADRLWRQRHNLG